MVLTGASDGRCLGLPCGGTDKPIFRDIHMYLYMYIHTYVHTYIHTCMHACMHACIHTYPPTHPPTHPATHLRTYVRTHVRTYMFFLSIFIHGNLIEGHKPMLPNHLWAGSLVASPTGFATSSTRELPSHNPRSQGAAFLQPAEGLASCKRRRQFTENGLCNNLLQRKSATRSLQKRSATPSLVSDFPGGSLQPPKP